MLAEYAHLCTLFFYVNISFLKYSVIRNPVQVKLRCFSNSESGTRIKWCTNRSSHIYMYTVQELIAMKRTFVIEECCIIMEGAQRNVTRVKEENEEENNFVGSAARLRQFSPST
ncbi:hypothetical protein LOAG_07234 [Loa loa]|uniref:Uncharacterized protein n=2 Tax=Loa loa TaxID=7209 RepID=A0A1S0TWP2_LOALO|nr:hypothetical protein LOAG_07234 [Loa loa]EFO21250.1 hypothetical protein LOAG_07234 [Loa loa]